MALTLPSVSTPTSPTPTVSTRSDDEPELEARRFIERRIVEIGAHSRLHREVAALVADLLGPADVLDLPPACLRRLDASASEVVERTTEAALGHVLDELSGAVTACHRGAEDCDVLTALARIRTRRSLGWR
jgi:hypothetical protein